MDPKPYPNTVLEGSLFYCLQNIDIGPPGPSWRRMELWGGEAQQVALVLTN